MIQVSLFIVLIVFVVAGMILFFPPIVYARQRAIRGYSDQDVTKVHQKLIEAREQQKPFHMSAYELNALRDTTNGFTEEEIDDLAEQNGAVRHDDQ